MEVMPNALSVLLTVMLVVLCVALTVMFVALCVALTVVVALRVSLIVMLVVHCVSLTKISHRTLVDFRILTANNTQIQTVIISGRNPTCSQRQRESVHEWRSHSRFDYLSQAGDN